jgi:hypothetical protein
MKFDNILSLIKRWKLKKLQIPNGLLVTKNHWSPNYNSRPPTQQTLANVICVGPIFCIICHDSKRPSNLNQIEDLIMCCKYLWKIP